MRGLKALVMGMGLLIIFGVIFLIYAIVQKSPDGFGRGFASDRSPSVSNVLLPVGAKVEETAVGEEQIVIRLRLQNGSERLLILNAVTGRLVGHIDLIFE